MRRVVLFALFVAVVSISLPSAPATGASESDSLDPATTDLEVFMVVDATPRQVAAVKARIARSPLVRHYAHIDKREAYREFKRIFAKNPELARSIRAADLPESFRIELRSDLDADRMARDARKYPGVDSAEPKWRPTEAEALVMIDDCGIRGDLTFEVFMHVRATPAQLEGVRQLIEQEPGLAIVRVLSKEDAYAEVQRLYASDPAKVRGVDPDDLPMSIRVRADGGYAPPGLTRRLEAAPGVESVGTPSDICVGIEAMLAQGLTREQIAKFVVARANEPA